MVVLNKGRDTRYATCWQYRGKSTDVKPVSDDEIKIPNGSSYFEFDSGKIFFWDADTETWNEMT